MKERLAKISEKAGQSLADPNEYQNLFPNYAQSLKAQEFLKKERQTRIPARDFPEIMVSVRFREFLRSLWGICLCIIYYTFSKFCSHQFFEFLFLGKTERYGLHDFFLFFLQYL